MKRVIGISKAVSDEVVKQWEAAYKKIASYDSHTEHPIAACLSDIDSTTPQYRFNIVIVNLLVARTRSSTTASNH